MLGSEPRDGGSIPSTGANLEDDMKKYMDNSTIELLVIKGSNKKGLVWNHPKDFLPGSISVGIRFNVPYEFLKKYPKSRKKLADILLTLSKECHSGSDNFGKKSITKYLEE